MNNKTQNTEPIIEVKDLMKSFGDNHVLINFNGFSLVNIR